MGSRWLGRANRSPSELYYGDWCAEEKLPTQRGLEDDIKEASLKAGTSLGAPVITSVLIRRLLRNW